MMSDQLVMKKKRAGITRSIMAVVALAALWSVGSSPWARSAECSPCDIPCPPADGTQAEKSRTSSGPAFGLVGAFISSPYKGHDDLLLPAPLIDYSGDRFYAQGAGAGVHLIKNENHVLSLGLSYSALEFDSGDTDDRRLKRLDDRHSTMLGNLSYTWYSPVGLFSAGASRDLLGNGDGFIADAWYGVPFFPGQWTLMPLVGVSWWDDKWNDYYFSVSERESTRSGLREYEAKNDFVPYVSVKGKYKFNECWEAVGVGKVDFLPREIRDSPMIDDRCRVSVMLGLQYAF